VVNPENHPGDHRKEQQDQGEARVHELRVKTMERYEPLLRRLAKE
jgi:hypothetical protein